MPLQIVRNNITKMPCDAIVNAANCSLLGGGGVDGAIHRAAGPKLLEECRMLGGCETGKAKITKGYNLPAKYVIHTPGPIWEGGKCGEEALLRSCYRECLALAEQYHCNSIAFPLISTGVYKYPTVQALAVATETIREYLAQHDMQVYITVLYLSVIQIDNHLMAKVKDYLASHYTMPEEPVFRPAFPHAGFNQARSAPAKEEVKIEEDDDCWQTIFSIFNRDDAASIEKSIEQLDEPFSTMLLKLIDAKGMSDVEVYRRANMDRKLFSKIRTGQDYTPRKANILALAVAMRLTMEETTQLLERAGYAFSPASKFDVIVAFFISERNYNIDEINCVLFRYDQPLLGG